MIPNTAVQRQFQFAFEILLEIHPLEETNGPPAHVVPRILETSCDCIGTDTPTIRYCLHLMIVRARTAKSIPGPNGGVDLFGSHELQNVELVVPRIDRELRHARPRGSGECSSPVALSASASVFRVA